MTSLEEVRARFARDQGLPFADALTERSILDALNAHGVQYRDRVFNPVTTIWGFLSQVLSEDHSCRDTVSRIIAHRVASGLDPCSPNTTSYCDARARLPTAVLRSLAQRTAQQLQNSLPDEWKWNGRSIFIADGSHVSMPDTEENQARYPQPAVQEPGIGFPLARVAVLLSLATGACHDLAIAPYAGKGTGETTLLRQMDDALSPGDVVVADALFDNYFIAWELRQRGIELVARVQAERVGSRTVESRPDGDIIVWQRPNKPRGMTGEQYRRYPTMQLEWDRTARLPCAVDESIPAKSLFLASWSLQRVVEKPDAACRTEARYGLRDKTQSVEDNTGGELNPSEEPLRRALQAPGDAAELRGPVLAGRGEVRQDAGTTTATRWRRLTGTSTVRINENCLI